MTGHVHSDRCITRVVLGQMYDKSGPRPNTTLTLPLKLSLIPYLGPNPNPNPNPYQSAWGVLSPSWTVERFLSVKCASVLMHARVRLALVTTSVSDAAEGLVSAVGLGLHCRVL